MRYQDKNKNTMYKSILLFILLLCPALIFGQKEGYLQLDAAVSKTKPIRPYSSFPEYYNGGTNVSADIDYFFGFAGIGLSAGYSKLSTTNRTSMLFMSDFIKDRLNSDELKWTHRYLMLGPTIKFSKKKLAADVYVKAGIAEVSAPDLEHAVNIAGNPFYILSPIEADKNVQFYWKAGARVMYSINSWMGLQLKVETVNSKWVNNTMYQYNYRNVEDTNMDGQINFDEYEIAETLHDAFKTSLSTINFGAGLFFQISPTAKEDKLRDFFASDDAERERVVLNDSILLANAEKLNTEGNEVNGLTDASNINNDSNKPMDQNEIESVLNEFYYDKSRDPSYYSYGEEQYLADLNLYEQGFADYFKKEYLHSFKSFSQIVNKNLFSLSRYMLALNLTEFGKCQEAKVEFTAFESIYGLEDFQDLKNIYLQKIGTCVEADMELDKTDYITGGDMLKKSLVDQETNKIEGVAGPKQLNKPTIDVPVSNKPGENNPTVKVETNKIDGLASQKQTSKPTITPPVSNHQHVNNQTADMGKPGSENNDQTLVANKTEQQTGSGPIILPQEIEDSTNKKEEQVVFNLPATTNDSADKAAVNTMVETNTPEGRKDDLSIATTVAGLEGEVRELTDQEKLALLSGRENLVYRVQFIALSRPNADFEMIKSRISDFRVDYFAERGLFRYTTGPYYTLDDAKAILEIARELKYHDAFIAIYDGDERIETIFHGMVL